MTLAAIAAADPAVRAEGWFWWLVVVICLVLVLLLLGMVRRHFLRPMPHTPTDTADAWSEAGRRLRVPPEPKAGGQSEDEASP
jgi:hypothetical protein